MLVDTQLWEEREVGLQEVVTKDNPELVSDADTGRSEPDFGMDSQAVQHPSIGFRNMGSDMD